METIEFSKSTLLCAVQKLSSTFVDNIGNRITGNGTGFWLSTLRGGTYFTTNRHNVDPSMHGENLRSYSLSQITIFLRAYSRKELLPCKDVQPLVVPINELTIYWPADRSDVVMLQPTKLMMPSDPNLCLLSLPQQATNYSRKPEIFDQLHFVGFPGNLRSEPAFDLPIARSCTIASFPEIDYSEEDKAIISSQTCLVEGLSFGGSSGSAVVRRGDTLEIMGIMSGHFSGDKWSETHTGLSYLTKATSIQNLIKDHSL